MPLAPGARLGPYEITAAIGAGGMGEVYRARDTRLGRDVAIKILPSGLAADDEARGRFEREARTISQLNHPHICVLYDIGRVTAEGATASQGEVDFLVMEFLEGESLAARIARGPIPPEEALEYAMQIADALDKAHRRGVVHRDLKPANVMLTKSAVARSVASTTLPAPSVAKLLDFGLAKLAPPPSVSSTETVLATSATGLSRGTLSAAGPATAAGTILGTFQYMAPEQVEGHEVDARADIWAFGCLLYEMLTGRRAFEGRTQASLIAAILERDPTPVSELQPLTPPALGRVVRTCLAKNPDARFQSAFDLLLQLQWIHEGGSAAGLPAPVIANRHRRERQLWIAVAVGTLAAGAAVAWWLKPAPAVAGAVSERFSFELPAEQAFSRTGRRYVAISPDGRRLAYIADKQIYLREMDQLTSKPIAGTNEDPLDLVFSPDGQWIAYFVPETIPAFSLKKIRISGGTPVPLAKTTWPYGVSWQGTTIVFGQNDDTLHGIASVPETSGTPATLVALDKNVHDATLPMLVDNGRLVLYTRRVKNSGAWDDAEIVIQAPGETTATVLAKGTDGHLIGGNRLVYYQGGTIFGIGVDTDTRKTRGGVVPVVEGVQSSTLGAGAGIFAVADNGTLVFAPGAGQLGIEPRHLVWVDRQGKEELIPAGERQYSHPRLSPDGRLIVVAVEEGSKSGLFTWDSERHVLSRLTPADASFNTSPVWATDGRFVIYRTTPVGKPSALARVDASGAGAPETLLEFEAAFGPGSSNGMPETVSPDGKLLLFRKNVGNSSDVLAIALDGKDHTPHPVLAGPTNEGSARISPGDGKLIAYNLSDTAGVPPQLFVRPYPDVAANRWQVANSAASDPVWARSGREIFFIDAANKFASASVQPGPVFGRVTPLLDNAPYLSAAHAGVDYDVSVDGQRFLMIRRQIEIDGKAHSSFTIVTHWADEVRARVK